MDLSRLALFAHLLAAFAFVAGYIATNVLTEVARRAATPAERREALAYSGRFDRWLNAPAGTAVIVTGLVAVWSYGYPITAPWIVASSLLFVALPLLGGLSTRRDVAVALHCEPGRRGSEQAPVARPRRHGPRLCRAA